MATDYKQYFKNKRITVMGLGLLGRGLGVVKFLSELGAIITVTDLKSESDLKPSLKQLKNCRNIRYVLGKHRLEDFINKDLIIKAAGVPLDSIYIEEAIKNKIPVEMDASLFARFTKATIIGVTGTRGKSTTASLIHEILKRGDRKVYLGGNIKGMATLPLLKKVNPEDYVVLELDSWQLQGFGDRKTSPHISIFTNLMPDHLNYYGGSMEKYFNDKANIFRYQKPEDYLIVGKNARQALSKFYKKPIRSKVVFASIKDIPKSWGVGLIGQHNLENVSYAIAVANLIGIKKENIRNAVAEFKSLPGRLEFIKEYRGRDIYNDTNSTTPEATLAGLKALSQDKNIILIMGGSNKNLEMNILVHALPKYCRAVVLIPGTGTELIRDVLLRLKNVQIINSINLEDAVSLSIDLSLKGDVILFSPAFASFGMFKNEYERGDKFLKIIKNL